MYSVGCMYYNGEGVEENWEKGAEWKRKALEAGDINYYLEYEAGAVSGFQRELCRTKWMR